MKIETLKALKDNYIYALVFGDQCAVIDPGESAPVFEFLARKSLRLSHILCTHHHWDHINGIADLLKEYQAEVWCSRYDIDRIPGATRAVHGHLSLHGESLQVLEVPGHTLGQIAYYFSLAKAVFPGDTLFSAGCGRLFEGSPEQMFHSLKQLAALPGDTQIYFGHEYTLNNLDFVEKYAAAPHAAVHAYRAQCAEKMADNLCTTPSRVADELAVNPFLRAQNVSEFSRWRELRNHW